MANRRGHGEGSIFRRTRDGRWVARVDLGWQDGYRKRKDMYANTRREAHLKLAAALKIADAGLPLPSERNTVGAFLEGWLRDVAQINVRPSTFIRYQQLSSRHIVPALGKRLLAKLSPQDLQSLYTQKLAEGLAPRTVGHLHRLLHRALADALRWGLVGQNICDRVSPPKVPAQEMKFLDPHQAKQLLEAAQGDELEALYTLALTAGLRQGELLALRWADLNLDTRQLRVQRTVRRIPGVGFVETEPKSARSRRLITLTPTAIAALRRHHVRRTETRLKALYWEDRDLVFANGIGRPLEPRNVMLRSFYPLLARAGLPKVRFHDLRHSAASLLLAQNVHPRIVADLLGHSSVTLTLNTYSHVAESLQAEAADKMEALLGRA